MTMPDEEFAREYARRSVAFVDQLPQQVEILRDDFVTWLSTPHDRALFDKLCRKVHQLKGAGGTFGCRSLSDAARTLEQRLAALPSDPIDGAASPAVDEARAAMETLRGEANRIYRKSAQSDQPRMHM